jgi:peptidoglycan/LPS O-acetylase OafA/YrhL
VIVIVGMTLLNTESMVTGWGWRSPEMVGIAKSLSIFSAAILVVLSLDASRFSTFLTLRPSQWLGSRSFSIYLIHYPIVLVVATFIGPSHLVIVVGLSVVLSLLAAEAFFLVVERPGHHLANWVGRRIATRDRSRSRPINAQAL